MAQFPNPTKSLLAYEQIRDRIIRGEKLPGTRLVIAELEAELGMGRGAIREALMRLDRSGLVRNFSYKGMVVAPPPRLPEIEYIYAMRADLEVFLATEAMNNLTPEDFERLEAFIEQFKNLRTVECTFFSLDRQFHACIYSAANMIHLSNIVDKIMDTIEIYLNLYTYEDEDQAVFVDEHIQIVALLRERNPETLAHVMRHNIHGGLRLVESAYKKIIRTPR